MRSSQRFFGGTGLKGRLVLVKFRFSSVSQGTKVLVSWMDGAAIEVFRVCRPSDQV